MWMSKRTATPERSVARRRLAQVAATESGTRGSPNPLAARARASRAGRASVSHTLTAYDMWMQFLTNANVQCGYKTVNLYVQTYISI